MRLLLPRVRLELDLPYTLQSGFYRLLDAFEARKLGESFSDQGVRLRFALLRDRQEAFQQELTTMSKGSLLAMETTPEAPDGQS
jgi:putative IMPACT (imprinted ancient) family translation regulator